MAHKLSFQAVNIVVFHCPACGIAHRVRVNADTGQGGPGYWSWNRSTEKPTFYPSLMVYGGHRTSRCHSFVRDGRIRFFNDCSHALAGQTVEIPDWALEESPSSGSEG